MNKFLSAKFLVFGIVFLFGLFFLSQAILGENVANIVGDRRAPLLKEGPTPVNTGKVGVWSKIGDFPTPRERHSVVYWDGYTYVLGGTIGWAFDGAVTSTVLFSPFNGTVGFGEWKYTKSIPGLANFDGAAFAVGGYVYVLGGSDDVNHSTASVWQSRVQADHSLGEWLETTSLPLAVSYHDVVYSNGFAYLVGGRHLDGQVNYQTNKVYFAQVNGDGSLGVWTETAALPVTLSGYEAVVNDGYLYVFGGANDPGYPENPVFYSKINSDGSLGAWNLGDPLPVKIVNFYAESAGKYVYLFGGSSQAITAMDLTFYAEVEENGLLSDWKKSTSMIEAVARMDGFRVGQQVVMIGGKLNFSGPGSTSKTIVGSYLDVMEGS